MALTDLLNGVRRLTRPLAVGLMMYGCGGAEPGSGGKPKGPTYEGMCDSYNIFAENFEGTCGQCGPPTPKLSNPFCREPDCYETCITICESEEELSALIDKCYNDTCDKDTYARAEFCIDVYCTLKIGGNICCDKFYTQATNTCREEFGIPPIYECPC